MNGQFTWCSQRGRRSNTDQKTYYGVTFQLLPGRCIEFKVNLAPKYPIQISNDCTDFPPFQRCNQAKMYSPSWYSMPITHSSGCLNKLSNYNWMHCDSLCMNCCSPLTVLTVTANVTWAPTYTRHGRSSSTGRLSVHSYSLTLRTATFLKTIITSISQMRKHCPQLHDKQVASTILEPLISTPDYATLLQLLCKLSDLSRNHSGAPAKLLPLRGSKKWIWKFLTELVSTVDLYCLFPYIRAATYSHSLKKNYLYYLCCSLHGLTVMVY